MGPPGKESRVTAPNSHPKSFLQKGRTAEAQLAFHRGRREEGPPEVARSTPGVCAGPSGPFQGGVTHPIPEANKQSPAGFGAVFSQSFETTPRKPLKGAIFDDFWTNFSKKNGTEFFRSGHLGGGETGSGWLETPPPGGRVPSSLRNTRVDRKMLRGENVERV